MVHTTTTAMPHTNTKRLGRTTENISHLNLLVRIVWLCGVPSMRRRGWIVMVIYTVYGTSLDVLSHHSLTYTEMR